MHQSCQTCLCRFLDVATCRTRLIPLGTHQLGYMQRNMALHLAALAKSGRWMITSTNKAAGTMCLYNVSKSQIPHPEAAPLPHVETQETQNISDIDRTKTLKEPRSAIDLTTTPNKPRKEAWRTCWGRGLLPAPRREEGRVPFQQIGANSLRLGRWQALEQARQGSSRHLLDLCLSVGQPCHNQLLQGQRLRRAKQEEVPKPEVLQTCYATGLVY
jgi:hypothetical protein